MKSLAAGGKSLGPLGGIPANFRDEKSLGVGVSEFLLQLIIPCHSNMEFDHEFQNVVGSNSVSGVIHLLLACWEVTMPRWTWRMPL